ncbi:MAG: GTPase ObgE [Planctomycetota bacterium]
MFRDEIEIHVVAGRGGDGLCSFRREKYVPKGGPDGGDGGDGGDVVFVATGSINSLLGLGRRPRYEARNGQPGGPVKCTGRSGDDLVLEVPVGTEVRDAKRGHMLKDLAEDGATVVIARGGRGGKGNASFATAVQQAPRRADSGQPGEERSLRLELKMVAEVGLVGLPNAGKSTFLSSVSRATPKIADYPFTTLEPQVGIATVGDFDTLVIADLPGLIEGAAEGHGLGHRFLRHVERCRVLLHLVDVSEGALEPPLESLRVIEGELERYSGALADRERILVASKVESPAAEAAAEALEAQVGRPVHRLSSQTGSGVDALLRRAREAVRGAGASS